MTKQTKKKRRDLHSAINALSRDEVAEIIRQAHPGVTSAKIDELAKAAIEEAHRLVSPRMQS
jgi:hypothetical protein